MSTELQLLATGKITHVKVTWKLTNEAYEEFIPVVDAQIQEHGKICMLFEVHDFHGWTAGALWEDLKFDFKHWRDIERLAIVGESKWQEGMAIFCKPFTAAKIQYFDHTNLDQAEAWIAED